jgi:WD40 repeat protein
VIVGGTSNLPTRANLVVVPTPAYSYSTIDRPSGASHGIASGNIIYDAERQALFVCDINLNVTTSTYFDRVERYRFDGISWTADLPLTFGAPHNLNSRIALSPDGDVLLKSGYNSMTHIDPVSLTVTANVSPQLTFESAATLNLLAMSNDGTALGDAFPQFRDPVYYRYNILDQAFYPVAIPGGFTELGNRLLRATGDGSRIMAASFASTVTKEPLFFYGATDIDFVQAPIETTYTQKLALDRTGSRAAIQDGAAVTVYDSAFTALGEVAKPNSMVVSPDGSALYTYSSSDNTLRKYDLTSTDGMGGFNQTGSILLADQPSDNGNTDMTISPDGGTLFLVGNLRVIVTPVP